MLTFALDGKLLESAAVASIALSEGLVRRRTSESKVGQTAPQP